jgi:hypothetical protein
MNDLGRYKIKAKEDGSCWFCSNPADRGFAPQLIGNLYKYRVCNRCYCKGYYLVDKGYKLMGFEEMLKREVEFSEKYNKRIRL